MDEKLALYSRIEAEYTRLLSLPFDTAERHYAQRSMALLRDLIADRWGATSEDVQTYFENLAFRTETAQKQPSPTETTVNEQGT